MSEQPPPQRPQPPPPSGPGGEAEAPASPPLREADVREVALADTRALRQAVLRPHQTLDQLAAEEHPGAHAEGAFEHGELVAVGIVHEDGERTRWRVRGMATAPAARGRGLGAAVLAALVAYARAHGALLIWCNARTPARRLYERAGFTVVSAQFELPHIGPHVRMQLELPPPGDAPAARTQSLTQKSVPSIDILNGI